MSDSLTTALHEQDGLTVAVALVTQVARELRKRHQLASTSAELLAQATAAAALLVSPQKSDTRLNLQLECDGPLGGLLVDASSKGELRGYVKNPNVDLKGNAGPYLFRAALGNSGFLSVLRDQGRGEHYRSKVALQEFNLEGDLAHYLRASDQVPSALALCVLPVGDEPLGVVAGALVQRLPDGDPHALEAVAAQLSRRLEAGLKQGLAGGALAVSLVHPGAKLLAERPLAFHCSCSKERVLATLAAMGQHDLLALHREQGKAAVTCQLCGQRHEVSGDELLALAATAEA